MTTHKWSKHFFVWLDYSRDTMHDIDDFFRTTGDVMMPLGVWEVFEEQIARNLA